jgi:DNA-directed RNA polymerase subunit RPC12/RpoP
VTASIAQRALSNVTDCAPRHFEVGADGARGFTLSPVGRASENTGFTCLNCGAEVKPVNNGSYRNHCPKCLHSRHVDERPGDRASDCGGDMVPQAVDYHPKKGYMLVHLCSLCGHSGRNKVAVDSVQPDDMQAVLALMASRLPRL